MEDYATMTCTKGLGTVTLADARVMNAGKLFVSSVWAENEMQCQCDIVQCATFWGVDHPATKVFIKAYRLFTSDKLHFQNARKEKYGPLLGPPMWVYHFHVHTIAWPKAQLAIHETESLPQILIALETFKIGSNFALMPSYSTIS